MRRKSQFLKKNKEIHLFSALFFDDLKSQIYLHFHRSDSYRTLMMKKHQEISLLSLKLWGFCLYLPCSSSSFMRDRFFDLRGRRFYRSLIKNSSISSWFSSFTFDLIFTPDPKKPSRVLERRKLILMDRNDNEICSMPCSMQSFLTLRELSPLHNTQTLNQSSLFMLTISDWIIFCWKTTLCVGGWSRDFMFTHTMKWYVWWDERGEEERKKNHNHEHYASEFQ